MCKICIKILLKIWQKLCSICTCCVADKKKFFFKLISVYDDKINSIQKRKFIFHFGQIWYAVKSKFVTREMSYLEILLNFHKFGNGLCYYIFKYKNFVTDNLTGHWCGSFGRAVACNTRGPRFESSHRRNLIMYSLATVLKRRKEKRGREFQKKLSI